MSKRNLNEVVSCWASYTCLSRPAVLWAELEGDGKVWLYANSAVSLEWLLGRLDLVATYSWYLGPALYPILLPMAQKDHSSGWGLRNTKIFLLCPYSPAIWWHRPCMLAPHHLWHSLYSRAILRGPTGLISHALCANDVAKYFWATLSCLDLCLSKFRAPGHSGRLYYSS